MTPAKAKTSMENQGKPKISAEWTYVTPELAMEWLEYNFENNRSIKRSYVEKLKLEMTSGSFKVTHQAIAFDEGGKLIDGQHRLTAIMESECGQWVLVCRRWAFMEFFD